MTVYPWQHPLWQHLLSYVQQQRIPQAILLTGAKGSGKRALAEGYAHLLLCLHPNKGIICGQCTSCKLVQGHSHPDYIVVEPEEPGKNIGIDQIRSLIQQLNLKPQASAFRTVIVQPADQLNNASANAFLKCLEEPTERTCFILITAKAEKLPATIHSRCQTIDCSVTDTKFALDWLQQQAVQDKEILLNMAYGAPLQAKFFAEQNYLSLRRECFDLWLEMTKTPDRLVEISEQWNKSETMDLTVVFSWFASWVVDLAKLSFGAEAILLSNPDLYPKLLPIAKQINLPKLFMFYDSLLHNKALLNTTLNKQLLIEQTLIDWWKLNHNFS